ncbi:hypothetical protein CDA63_00910 [Hymenobacter amundsenii]|uniref:Uncharacterized protein n=1 Tax=Hymenobacter amundsenii TaxID=2006685 RepID=A0A246FQI7_9BACT|nr:hypothetical protein [Hymenobacter amundsenii]OWP64949.1 hypothetical protein CDA63_00910 [Hymenobacter amundsenii]
MRTAIEKRFTHCRQKGCIQVYPEVISYYADLPGEAWVTRVADEHYDEERHFKVRNPGNRPIHLAAIDKCLIGRIQPAPKRCDCVFFEDRDVCFVEFKIRAEGRDAVDDRNQETRLLEAGEQLLASIQQFEADGILTDYHRVRAYAFVGYGPLFPAPTTTLLSIAEYIDSNIRSSIDFDAKDNVLF